MTACDVARLVNRLYSVHALLTGYSFQNCVPVMRRLANGMGKGPVNRAQKWRVILLWHLGAIDRSNWISREGRNNFGQLTSEKTESCKTDLANKTRWGGRILRGGQKVIKSNERMISEMPARSKIFVYVLIGAATEKFRTRW